MKIECVHVCVTVSPCCTVEKNCIGEITIKKIRIITKKRIVNKLSELEGQEVVMTWPKVMHASDGMVCNIKDPWRSKPEEMKRQ